MENMINIKEYLQILQDENKVTTQRKNLLIPIGVLLAGVVLLIINFIKIFNNDIIQTILGIIGIICLIIGLVLLISACQGVVYIYSPWNCKIKEYNIYFDHTQKQQLYNCINHQQWQKLQDIPKNSGSSVCLHAFVCTQEDKSIAMIQISEYVPYQFIDTTPVITLEGNDAQHVIQYVKK